LKFSELFSNDDSASYKAARRCSRAATPGGSQTCWTRAAMAR
jgi:hypothetical protein